MAEAMKIRLQSARESFLVMSQLSEAQRNEALVRFSQLLLEQKEFLLEANAKDLAAQKGQISASLYQRLQLDDAKIETLAKGLRDLSGLKDPIGETLLRRRLDDGLILEKRSVPLGVLGVIFESRPDVIPQVLSLVLKSGNAALLKGGKEAIHSNQAFMKLVDQLNEELSFMPSAWAQLLESRADVAEMLEYHDDIDLVIPRGSNQLVQQVMDMTKIPVLGHADGVCHIYVSSFYPVDQAVKIIIDAKTQYPSACNAMETLLVEESVFDDLKEALMPELERLGVRVKAGSETLKRWPGLEPVDDWHHEYSDLAFSLKIVRGLDEAISHINQYGSHHTDAILSLDSTQQVEFIKGVDSANVFVNTSTRFADGYRYGMGAEVGISTAKTHARGPVGLEGLVIYKYVLVGDGQIVADYSGNQAKSFRHEDI